jgi:hypothetical protein
MIPMESIDFFYRERKFAFPTFSKFLTVFFFSTQKRSTFFVIYDKSL